MLSPLLKAQVLAILKPFNIAAPMARSHYWVFHLLAALLINVSVYVGQGIELVMMLLGLPWAGAFGNAFVLVAMLWIFTALITAMARRMRDRGFARYSLVVLLGLGVCFSISFLRDVLGSYLVIQGQSSTPPLPVQWRTETFIIFVMMLPALVHVFLGLTGRSKAAHPPQSRKS